MRADWGKIVGVLVEGLRSKVMPHLADDGARVQLNAIIYVLANLRLQGDWSAALRARHVEAQQQLFAALRGLDGLGGLRLPDEVSATLTLEQGDAAVIELIDARFAAPVGDCTDALLRSQQALASYLRQAVAIDCEATARSMMFELSGSGSASI